MGWAVVSGGARLKTQLCVIACFLPNRTAIAADQKLRRLRASQLAQRAVEAVGPCDSGGKQCFPLG